MKHRGKQLGGEWLTGEFSTDKGFAMIDGIVVDISTVRPFSDRHDSAGREIYAGDVLGWQGKEERGIVKYDLVTRRFIVEVNGEWFSLASVLKKGVEVREE